jgi:hypothetical protein
MTDPKVQALAIRQSVGVERLGQIMHQSGFFADARSQAQAIVKILAGAELDFGPVASMNGIYILNGRTTLSAQLVAAAIQRSGRYRYRVVEHTAESCTLDFFELEAGKREKIGTSSFSMADAHAAGLDTTANWKKWPRNMLWARALTNGARWFCPDVFSGAVYTPDELGAEVDEEGNPIEVIEAPAERYVPFRERDPGDQPRPAEVPPKPVSASPKDVVSSADDRVWQRWLEVRTQALGLGVREVPELRLPLARTQLVSAGAAVAARVEARQQELAEADAERDAGARKHAAWERNRALQAQAYAAGVRMSELPNSASLVEIEERNLELEAALDSAL